ncbi:MAG: NAD(P)H-hydrate dehydratase [Pseudomonadota bacterium]
MAAARPIYFSAQIREVEARARQSALMERAGIAAANLARQLLDTEGKSVLVIAGPGNNGGDALVAARHLKSSWFNVTVLMAGNADNLPPDAAQAWQAWRDAGGSIAAGIPADTRFDLVIDGLYGIGLQRDLAGNDARLVAAVNTLPATKLALDTPSGIHADSGRVMGCAVRADHTLTFIGLKPGLLTGAGLDYCGELHLDTLDVAEADLPAPAGWTVESNAPCCKPRPQNSHKGQFGSIGILGGAPGMVGAALLAGRAALHTGAGRVYVGLIDDTLSVDVAQPELMLRKASEIAEFGNADCLIAGMGLGQSSLASESLHRTVKQHVPLLLDADALNILSHDAELQAELRARSAVTVLTPHPGEAARLLGLSTQAVQDDRIGTACKLARHFATHVVLKGAGSVCVTPAGEWTINASGNPGLSSPGTGDVLAGMIGTLIAQNEDVEQAVRCAVYLHGAAADELSAQGTGPIGLTASELLCAARRLLNENCRTIC